MPRTAKFSVATNAAQCAAGGGFRTRRSTHECCEIFQSMLTKILCRHLAVDFGGDVFAVGRDLRELVVAGFTYPDEVQLAIEQIRPYRSRDQLTALSAWIVVRNGRTRSTSHHACLPICPARANHGRCLCKVKTIRCCAASNRFWPPLRHENFRRQCAGADAMPRRRQPRPTYG